MKLIIAISGWKGSGKDTVANQLISNFGFERIAFADPLKDNVSNEFGVPRNYLDIQEMKEQPILSLPIKCKDTFSWHTNTFMYGEFVDSLGRHPNSKFEPIVDDEGQMWGKFNLLYGNEYETAKLYHCPRSLAILEGSVKRSVDSNHWVKKAIGKTLDSRHYVISDLRYTSEVEAMKNSIKPEDILVTLRVNRFKDTQSQDSSERDLDLFSFDYVIENKGTLEDLELAVKNIVGREFLKIG